MTEWSGRRAQRLTAAVLERDGGICVWCGGPASTADHLIPRSKGGAVWDMANLAAACLPCNTSRGARPRPARVAPRASRQW